MPLYAQVDNASSQERLALLIQKAALQEQSLGSGNLQTARTYLALGNAYVQLSEYRKGLELYQKAREVFEQQLAADDPETGALYKVIGDAYSDIAIYDRALWFHQQALQIYISRRPDDLDVGHLYRRLGLDSQNLRSRQAADYYIRAIRFFDARLGLANVESASVYNQIGGYYFDLGQRGLALEGFHKALMIQEPNLGPDHPDTARTYANLGRFFSGQGDFDQSLEYYAKAQRTFERVFGSSHPETVSLYENMGILFQRRGDSKKALEYYRRSFEGFFATQESAFQALDSAGKVRYNQKYQGQIGRVLISALDLQRIAPGEGRNALQAVFGDWASFKGSAFAFENSLGALRQQMNPKFEPQLRRLSYLHGELGRLYTAQPLSAGGATVKVAEQIQRLEAEMSALQTNFAPQMLLLKQFLSLRRVNLEDLRSQLREGEVFLDYAWLEDRVLAFGLERTGRVQLVQLGSPITLWNRVSEFRALLQMGDVAKGIPARSFAELQPSVRALYRLLVAPLNSTTRLAKTLVISPDGPLHLLPFDLLWDGQKTLLESHTILYTPSARDFVRQRRSPAVQNLKAAAIFGNPFFDAAPSGGLAQADPGPLLRALVSAGVGFPILEGSGQEIKEVLRYLGSNTQVFTEDAASENNLFALQSPRVLHFATHGFVVSGDDLPNPLLRVGIALAGAQLSLQDGRSYGIVSGMAIAGLNLVGTQLVVISGCETGLGDIALGEGVAGLNQAVMMAGAQRVVLSLWKVPDAETAQLMREFYRRWTAGTEYAQALREAKRQFLARRVPPQLWAAFILSGS